VYLQQGRLDVALEEFSLASKIEPSYAAAYNGLGLVQAALGQDAVAELNFKKAVQLEPLNSEAHNNYGSFLCARNRLDESIKEFMAALKTPCTRLRSWHTPMPPSVPCAKTTAFRQKGICCVPCS
jgi:type IV pilus assembly protein PilF